ncbi:MAG: hypothetical protein KC419_09885 [Anaerolineales bacterium]|nr:hypothetical protein [Anaerolineales bacterium]
MSLSFREKLIHQEQLVGTIVTLPAPAVAELLSQIGFDWLFIDAEHAPLSPADVQILLQAAKPTPCLVRIPELNGRAVKQVLDSGAAGIIAPMVNTAVSAAQIVQWAKYPPVGTRSVGIARAQGYGQRFQEYVANANDETAVVVQIEHIDAVHNIAAIVAVPGVDAIFLGPYDLSASLGKPGRVQDAEVTNAITHVEHICREVNIPMGIFGMRGEGLRPFIQRGYSLLTVGIDTVLLGNAAKTELHNINSK